MFFPNGASRCCYLQPSLSKLPSCQKGGEVATMHLQLTAIDLDPTLALKRAVGEGEFSPTNGGTKPGLPKHKRCVYKPGPEKVPVIKSENGTAIPPIPTTMEHSGMTMDESHIYVHIYPHKTIQYRYRYRYKYRYKYNATQCNTHTNSQPCRHAYIHSYHLKNPISCSSHPNHLWSGAKLHASCDTTMTVTIFSRFSCVTKIPNATFFENVGMKLP